MRIFYLTSVKPDEFNLLQILATHYQHEIHLLGGREEYRSATDVTLYDRYNLLVNGGKLLNRLKIGDRGFFVKQAKLIDTIQPDVVHALSANTWGVIAATLPTPYPLVVTCTGSDIFRFPFTSPRVFQQVKHTLHRADLIHVLSTATVAHLTQHFQVPTEKIIPSPWGINLQVIDKTLSAHNIAETRSSLGFEIDDIILFAPRGIRSVFRPIQYLIEIIAPLMQANDKIKILLMMHVREDQAIEKKLREDIAYYNFEKRVVTIERFLPHSKMIELFHAADITISLAESDETSLATLEAMYCGTIPVLSETLTYPTVLKEGRNAFFVQNDQIPEIRTKLAYILDHLEKLKQSVQNANLQLVRCDFDRHKNIHKIEEIYQTVRRIKQM